ncbi:putative methyltransferase-domain-containing protein [Phascolomyces articulosus]|uniref:Methyltransferase-domain-containing protein n=1 Tax=Phascolomyces articulosus TaxID=60185 RepID=A0AAD5KNR5_9FUNG|nr:putative methyltransferase-domain-containing protein [Phascolomyces articulosus]
MSLKTISPLIVMDPMQKRSFKIQMVEDDTETDENDFYQSLHRHSILHRLVLSRPLPRCLSLDTWYRIDLEVVNELGLPLKGERNASCCIHLMCELYVVDTDRGGLVRAPTSLNLSYRPLQIDGWDDSNALATTTTADEPGFHQSGQGGIEIKVSLASQQDARCMMQYTTKAKYLIRIASKSDSYQTVDVFPLTLGPLEFKKNRPYQQQQQRQQQNHYRQRSHHHHHQQQQQQQQQFKSFMPKSITPSVDTIGWNTGGDANVLRSETTYRLYSHGSLLEFGSGSKVEKAALLGRYFVVKEVWKMGTPGKIWDSALVLSDMFAKKIMQERTCLDGKHIVDLSAGTGCIGLLLGTLLRRLRPQHTCQLTLTDLPEALDLIRENHRLNVGHEPDPHIHIEKLCWGITRDAKQLIKKGGGGPDLILASDVLYDPKCFSALVDTLKALCVPGKTVIYLGYKRRGLKQEEEKLFFDLVNANFDITTVGTSHDHSLNHNGHHYDQGNEEEYQQPIGWEKDHGFMKRNHLTMDGRGWLGPAGTDSDIFDEARQEGKVIIYRLVKSV